MELSSMVFAFVAFNSLILAIAAFGFSIYAVLKVLAMEKSTHSIQYMPVDKAIDEENNEYLKSLQGWATSEERLKKEQEMFKEDLEDFMPDLAPDEDDHETYSF